MIELFLSISTIFGLGVLTSISPCPLATNIAAVSYIGQKVTNPYKVFLSGLLYTLGRIITYVAIGWVLVSSVLSTPSLSHILQKYMNMILGPILIITGLILLEMISIKIVSSKLGTKLKNKVDTKSALGPLFLGILFAISFCPTSAALYFGSLIPISIKLKSSFLVPAIYGIGTGIPVLVFTIILSLGVTKIGKIFEVISKFEKYARNFTGVVFIIVGIYYCLIHVFNIL